MTSEGWSPQINRECLTDDVQWNFFPSPDKAKTIVASKDGFSVTVDGTRVFWPEGKEISASGSEVSWSPTSEAFFINDGNGSGLDGWTLKVYTISGRQIVNHTLPNTEIIRRFRMDLRCAEDAVDPNVRGIGWSKSGAHLYAFAQTTVNQPCGEPGDFRGFVVSVSRGELLRFYSEVQTRNHFRHLLPYNMR